MTRKKMKQDLLESTPRLLVNLGNGGKSSKETGGKTTAFPTDDDLPEPTEEDLNRRFMIVENEHGQPEMAEVFFVRDLPDEDCEDEPDGEERGT